MLKAQPHMHMAVALKPHPDYRLLFRSLKLVLNANEMKSVLVTRTCNFTGHHPASLTPNGTEIEVINRWTFSYVAVK